MENESINLDWMFRYSLINDIVKVCAGQAEPAGNWTVKQKEKKMLTCVGVSLFKEKKNLKSVRKVTHYVHCFVDLR